VYLVDDHEMVRSALARVLDEKGGLSIVGQANCVEDAWAFLQDHSVDVVIADLDLPDACGVELVTRLLDVRPSQGIVILSYRLEPREVQSLVEAGVRGYVPKTSNSDELLVAIRAVAEGKHYFASAAATAMAMALKNRPQGEQAGLSERQKLVLERMAKGLTTKEIAEELFLSPKTIEKYRSEIFRRLSCKNQVQAIQAARSRGWLSN
jgi:DNA-binding NarL/FixJ family response regulator